MAATDFGAISDAQVRVWAQKTWKEGRDNSFWCAKGFVSSSDEDHNKPVSIVTKLSPSPSGAGLSCVMQLVADMDGDGIVGDNQLEGNEEALTNDVQIIQIDQLRNGVKSKGKMAEQATVIRFRAEARGKLSFWLSEKIDELMHLTVAGRAYTLNTDGSTRAASQLPQLSFASDVVASSAGRIIHAGAATSEGAITNADKMSWELIIRARSYAYRQKLRPIRDGGKDYFVLLMSTEQSRDLDLDSTYQTIVSRAAEKGSKNPLFMNAKAVVGGVVLHEHNKTYNTQGLASGSKWGVGGLVDGAHAHLLGAQALGFARVGEPFMGESDNTDYKNRPGTAFGRKLGLLKPQFITRATQGAREDFGVIAVKSAAAA